MKGRAMHSALLLAAMAGAAHQAGGAPAPEPGKAPRRFPHPPFRPWTPPPPPQTAHDLARIAAAEEKRQRRAARNLANREPR